MNKQLRLLIVLGVLLAANLGWRVWANWGKVTIEVTDAPVSEVLRTLEKQAGIRLRSNLPSETKVTMHVRKVSLLHALEVLAASTEANWNVNYFTAPNKGTINNALAAIANGQQPEGWKRFGIPGGRMRGDSEDSEEGVMDPREEEWNVKPASEGTLHAYLQQAGTVVSAQFWAPEQWNPQVANAPGSGEVENVIPKLAKAARGETMEVFVLRGRSRGARTAANSEQPEQDARRTEPRLSSGSRRGGLGGEEMRKAMEERELARIERLPSDKKADALAALEERKKFFEELSALPEEERRARMEERMEQMMNDPARSAQMSAASAKRGAMQTADQRTDRYRDYMDRKREMN